MIRFWYDIFRAGRASHRLRAELPCQGLKARGVDCTIINRVDQVNPLTDIVIFSKDTKYPDRIRQLKSMGVPVGFDICDNKFDQKPKYADFGNMADFITVNSAVMAQEVQHRLPGKPVYEFTDSCERSFEPARGYEGGKLRFVWYGGSASMKYFPLDDVLDNLYALEQDWQLDITSGGLQHKIKDGGFKVCMHEWSYNVQGQLVRDSDIVIIPVKLGGKTDYRTRTKSHNRLVDAIAQGRWCITTPLPAYRPLQKYSWQGDISKGIRYYINNKQEVENRITQGQTWIKKRASKNTAAKQLIRIYEHIKGITIT